MRVVCDSSANLQTAADAGFYSVPLRIMGDNREFVDNEKLDVREMLDYLAESKNPTGTACPGINDWLEAFGDEEYVIGATLTSKLSGAYNSAIIAAREYMEAHPGRQVYILDSLSTGPELQLIAERCLELARSGKPFAEICRELESYRNRTALSFILGSLDCLARNGRVSPTLAKITGVLNIHIVGRASVGGELEPQNKCPGLRRSLEQLWRNIRQDGYQGGKMRIHHTLNAELAEKMAALVKATFPNADLKVGEDRGLCSYYAEKGGLLVGFECGPAAVNA